MPKFTRNIAPEDQAQIQEAGQNPNEYLLDEESGRLIHQDDTPGLGVSGNIGEFARGLGRGALATVTAPFALGGTAAELVHQATGGDRKDKSFLTTGVEKIKGLIPEADPRAHWLVSGGGEAVGNIGGMILPAGLASKIGTKAARNLAVRLGGAQMGEDTAEQEIARQIKAGENSPGKTALKAGIMMPIGAGLEHLGGVGRLLDDLSKPANTAGQIALRAGENVVRGGATEAGQQAVQDTLVEGQPDATKTFRAGVLGGLAQGAASGGLDVLTRDSSQPWFDKKIEPDVEGLKGNVETPPAGYTPSEETVAATLRRQEMDKKNRPKRMISNPVDDVTDKLMDSGVALDKDKVLKLYEIWNGKEENVEALQTEARRMQDEAHALGPVKPRTTLDVIGEQQDIGNKYDKLIKAAEFIIAKNTKLLADTEVGPGTRLRAQAELVEAQRQLDVLLTQRTTELGGIPPADPIDTRVVNVPKAPNIDTGAPGVRTTVSRESRPAGFPNPAQVTDVQTLERGNLLPAPESPTPVPSNPQVTPQAIGPAIPMGTGQRASERAILTPGVPEVDPIQEAARIQREKERQILSGQEGEQGSPFGEGTRYSGINPKTLLEPARELARRARQFVSQAQLQDRAFILSGVAALNNDRPWGMQVAGDGKLPTSGLVPKMAANIPKGEMEVYKAAGLEEWLKGRGRVGREELQQWMMENGPQLEVKELRPGLTGAESQEQARIEHQLDTQFGDWADALDPSAKVRQAFFDANPAAVPIIDRYHELNSIRRNTSSDSTIGRYQVEPRPAGEMEGPVELLVRVPFDANVKLSSDGLLDIRTPEEIAKERKSNVLWRGGHHGQSGQNTVGFGRANVETLPDGRKVLHLFEVQSDWGQRVRKEQTDAKALADEGVVSRDVVERQRRTPDHPLLPESNRLVLKAALKYAVENGLDGIAISDAETAMITEGHDEAAKKVQRLAIDDVERLVSVRASRSAIPRMFGDDWRNGTFVMVDKHEQGLILRIDKPENNEGYHDKPLAKELKDAGYGQKEGAYIPQEGGMRLNYDQKLPKIAKELTGFDGERVSFGPHWKAQKAESLDDAGGVPLDARTAPLIFKNPDGSPKTDITARVYPIEKVKRMIEDQAAFTLFGSDKSYYSGIDPRIISNFFKQVFKHGIGPNLLYHLHKGTTSRMATLNPEGAYMKWMSDAQLTNERNRFTENLLMMARPLEKFLNDTRAIKWLNERSDKKDWDISTLPKELQGEGLKYKKFIEDVADAINSHGVYVREIDPTTGKITFRPHKKAPGYFPWMIGEQVFTATGDELAAMKKEFTDGWVKKFGKGAERAADVAFQNLLGITTHEGVGAGQNFGPVRLPQGITLPESMRSKSPVESLNRYIRGVSRDLGWAVALEQNPVARRILGMHRDSKGMDTFKTDPTTWDQVPEAWAYAVREGRMVRAKWARKADINKPPNSPINLFNDSKLLADMQAGYRQAASPFPHLQALSNVASAIIMETPSGTRDVATSAVATAVLTNPARAVASALQTIISPVNSVRAARKAGAIQGDMLAAEQIEAGKVIARSLMKTARGIRKYLTGRDALDTYGQTMLYNALMEYMQTPGGDRLIQEFGPAFDKNMSRDDKVRITVGRLVERYSNKATPQNLTPGMLPHAGNPLSTALSLTRWSQAQWNNFSEDVINKWLNDKGDSVALKRLLTWGLGSVIAGSAINKLWEEINKRKPKSLTWGEWLRVFNRDDIDKDRKAKEFAYTAATQLQTIGTLGSVGDLIVMPAVKRAAGDKSLAPGSMELQYPAAIVAMDWYEKTRSFFAALSDGRATGDDFWEYLLELTKTAQNVKVAQKLLEHSGAVEPEPRRGARELDVFERVLEKDAQRLAPLAGDTGLRYQATQDPFSFNRQMMRGEDPWKYQGFLQEQRRGKKDPPRIPEWGMKRRYYEELEKIIGEEEARKRMEEDQKMDRAIRQKNREIRRVR